MGKVTVWVHVGLPKCGSTTVQRYFSAHAEAFRAQGLCYPETGRSKGGYRSHEPIARAPQEALPALVEAIAREAKGCDRILISCEDFANALPLGNGAALLAELNRVFGAGQVRVLAYFRNVDDFVESCYAQFIMGGLFKINAGHFFHGAATDLAAFVAAFEALKGFPLYSLRGHADQIARQFSDNAVVLKSIERADIGEGGLIADICRTLEVAALEAAPAQNTRVSNLLLAVAHAARRQVSPDEFRRLRPYLAKMANGPKWAARAGFDRADLHVDAALHTRVAATMAVERADLAARFSTGIAGLSEDRWVARTGQDALTEAEVAQIRRLIARHRGGAVARR
jgi:hypothetical protein